MGSLSGSEKDLRIIKALFEELLHILEKEGDPETDYAQNELAQNIARIDTELSSANGNYKVVLAALRESYRSMYPPQGGLTDFFIWREEFEERLKVNQPLNKLKIELDSLLR